MKSMKTKILIAGLGNDAYPGTRHSIGLSILSLLVNTFGRDLKEVKSCNSLIHRFPTNHSDLIFLRPLLPMNSNGKCIKNAVKKYGVEKKRVLIIHDDLDFPLGTIKIKHKGSSGGHRGVQSVIDELKTEYFTRFRVGIGRPEQNKRIVDYVLEPFNSNELSSLETVEEKSIFLLRDEIARTIANDRKQNVKDEI